MYKVGFYNPLCTIFRNKNFAYAKKELDILHEDYKAGHKLTLGHYARRKVVKEEHFLESTKLYNFLTSLDDFMIRIEFGHVSFYTNDEDDFNFACSLINKERIEVTYIPDPNIVLDANTIVIEGMTDYEYKCTLGNANCDSKPFAKWAEKNPKQVKVGYKCLEYLHENGYVKDMYFYAKNDKTLQIVSLLYPNIRKIDKIINKADIDK